jgi:uncharacterized membrane protein YhiD involved in acid resistance
MIAFVLLLAAAAFIGYAVFTKYTATDPTLSVPKRVWAAVVAGAGALGAALVQWVHGMTAP